SLGNFQTSTSPNFTQTVISPTTITATPSANPSVVGASVGLQITIVGVSSVPTGTVTVTQGALAPVTKPLTAGAVTFTLDNLALGGTNIVIVYNGDSAYAPNSQTYTQTVNQTVTTTVL